MKRIVTSVLGVWLAVIAATATAQERIEYLLRVNKPTNLERVCKTYQLTRVRSIGRLRLTVVAGPVGVTPEDLVARVLADRNVRTFELDHIALTGESAAAHPDLTQTTETLDQALAVDRTLVGFYNDLVWSGYANQPAVGVTAVDTAHALKQQGRGVIVAIIDTGIDLRHPHLSRRLLDAGYDFTANREGASEGELVQSTAAILDGDTCDEAEVVQSTATILDARLRQSCAPAILNQSTAAILDSDTIQALAGEPPLPAAYGHGTMVAGLVHLVAPRAKILPLKAFKADGSGRSSDIAQAIYYAVFRGAQVINMSFTFAQRSHEVMWATAYAALRGVVLVGSAGNHGLEMRAWPAEHKWVVGVGSTNLNDIRSSFSNHGYDVFKVGAPGENLITTYPGGRYAAVSGTSFSAALVSGAVALMKQAAPLLSWGTTDDVVVQAPFADITGVARDSSNRYPKRMVVPPAVALAPELQKDDVRQINMVK
jgi:subtilisin family serine protease